MGRGVIAKNDGTTVYIKNRGGKLFDEKRTLYQNVKVVPGENIKMGDYLIFERSHTTGRVQIKRAAQEKAANCFAGEDLTNIDGTAFLILPIGAVYNNV